LRLNWDALDEGTPADLAFRYVDISGVDELGRITGWEDTVFERAPSRARRLASPGDVVLSTVRTYLRAIAMVPEDCADLVFSTGFAVLHPREQVIDGRFLWRVLQAEPYVQWIVAHSQGVGYPAINPSELGQLRVGIPPITHQHALAAFLDRETARIDALIAKKERLLELLEEKRTALITRAVTKGLDPTVPMKESGVEWLGEVPKHWDIKRNKLLFREVRDLSDEGTEELLTVSHITGVTPRSEKEVYMFMAESMEGYKRCRPGDVVVNTMWAYMGALGVAPRDGIVSPAYNVYRPRGRELLIEYFDLLCRTPAYMAQINQYSEGVWRSRLRLVGSLNSVTFFL